MTIENVGWNNRTAEFTIEAGGRALTFPYAILRLKPTASNRIVDAFPDPELGGEAFTYWLESGDEDSIHLDAVLDFHKDPAYLNGILMHQLTVQALEALEQSSLGRRQLARLLDTSPAQLYRLLDPADHGKSVGQMLALLHFLGRKVDVVVS
ncbi:MAG: hypothetical protein O3C45_05955 [Bacteroidetes bacterium]|nr:hypothetical protein [Bacteroidota bacterium]MDA0874592.1 hypothetical protein [Bacteroidota bacterium]